jgi:hypothetical protein
MVGTLEDARQKETAANALDTTDEEAAA